MEASQLRRRRALADALAGVVATLVSLWTFYPIDVLKTKLQAGVDAKGTSSDFSIWNSKGLFRGLPIKTLHAASSSFTYFYLYSFIVSWWTSGSNKKKMSPAVRLSLSAIAAMLNTLLTCPLDVMASKKQASQNETSEETDTTQEESDSEDGFERLSLMQQQQLKMDRVWQNLERTNDNQEEDGVQDGDIFYDSCSEARPQESNFDSEDVTPEEGKEEDANNDVDFGQGRVRVTVTTTCTALDKNSPKMLHFEPTTPTKTTTNNSQSASSLTFSQLPSLWKGLYPSLLLCSNPSIHYTVFDMAKSHLLQSKMTSQNLSMAEAFLLGLFAKFCATIATYPLIRAKIMLMVTSRQSMLRTLLENYHREGIAKGLYKGCSVQLFHTVLKSALMMMVKERIAATTHRLLVPSNINNVQSAAAKS